jgi:hypothetical protein
MNRFKDGNRRREAKAPTLKTADQPASGYTVLNVDPI